MEKLTPEEIRIGLSNFQFSTSDTKQRKICPVNRELFCIWFYDERLLKFTRDEIENRLRQIFSYVKPFTNKDELIDYLISLHIRSFFFISNGDYAEYLCRFVKQQPKFENVHAYELELDSSTSFTNSEFRIVCYGIDELFQCIHIDIKKSVIQPQQQPQDQHISIDDLSPTFGLFNSKLEEKWFFFLSNDSLKFLLFRLCFKVLTGMNHDTFALDEMCSYCRNQYKVHTAQLQKIDKFRATFDAKQAVYYYTENSFVHYLINQAFRSEDIERIFKCRHYITHLHQHLAKQVSKQNPPFSEKYIYRGQKLPIATLQQLADNTNKLISMYGFLSATRDCRVGAEFACVGPAVDGYESVIYQMEIDRAKLITMTCADISEKSNSKQEGEILFSIGSVWKLVSVEKIETVKNEPYWQIDLCLHDDIDSELTQLDDRLTNGFTFLSLGNILRELGDKSNAENFYYRMLDVPNLSDETRGHIHYNLGTLAAELGRYADALRNIETAEKLLPSKLALNDHQETTYVPMYSHNRLPTRIRVLNTLGVLYQKKGNYEHAREWFMKALSENGHDLEKAVVNNNLGLLEFDYGNYDKSLQRHCTAIKLANNYVWLDEFKTNWDTVREHLKKVK